MNAATMEFIGTRTERGFEISCPSVELKKFEIHRYDNADNLTRLIKKRSNEKSPKLVHRSREILCYDRDESPGIGAHFYQLLTGAYRSHVSITLRPEVMWHLIAHETGVFINQHQAECAAFFTNSPDSKKKLEIFMQEGESWEKMLARFRSAFEPHIASDVLRTFLPSFTTSDVESETATLLTFMDTVSPWYEYGGFQVACGFPKILIQGTTKDWQLLQSSVKVLSDMLEGMRSYFQGLNEVLDGIISTIESGVTESDFWNSMFRYQASSGYAYIDGWLSAFVLYLKGEPPAMRSSLEWKSGKNHINPDRLRDGVNYADMTVQFENGNPAQKLTLVSGVLGSEYDGEFLIPRLGFAVADVT